MPAEFSPVGVDIDHANAARVYDYFLGGSHNFAVDRELGDRMATAMPSVRAWARGNRSFLMRAVRYCVEQGVRQFLDLGSGVPTADHVHETARGTAPETRVAYVDVEPVAVAYSRHLLSGVPGVSVTQADIRDPAAVLSAATVTDVLDFGRPVAVLAVAVMHFVADDDDPPRILDGYRDRLAPGSFVALTNTSTDYDDPELSRQLELAAQVAGESATPAHLRDRASIRAMFGDLALVEPGLVDIAQWRSDDPDAAPLGSYAAVARVPG